VRCGEDGVGGAHLQSPHSIRVFSDADNESNRVRRNDAGMKKVFNKETSIIYKPYEAAVRAFEAAS
jgi:hypothetical protein